MAPIKVSSLNKSYNFKKIIDNLSLVVEDGEFISLVGPYGCGKSTLLRLISGLETEYSGEIIINGVGPEISRQERKIGYCFQKPTLLPWRTLKENLLLPIDISGASYDRTKIDGYLSSVNLSSFADSPVKELSGGMQQLAGIIRGLVLDPNILLLDEPLSAIDEISREKIQEMLMNIHNASKKTTIMITHSINEAVFLSDRVVVLSQSPAKIKGIVEIRLQERNKPFRYSAGFIEAANKVRLLLENE